LKVDAEGRAFGPATVAPEGSANEIWQLVALPVTLEVVYEICEFALAGVTVFAGVVKIVPVPDATVPLNDVVVRTPATAQDCSHDHGMTESYPGGGVGLFCRQEPLFLIAATTTERPGTQHSWFEITPGV
jgi:hypothetical protein